MQKIFYLKPIVYIYQVIVKIINSIFADKCSSYSYVCYLNGFGLVLSRLMGLEVIEVEVIGIGVVLCVVSIGDIGVIIFAGLVMFFKQILRVFSSKSC